MKKNKSKNWVIKQRKNVSKIFNPKIAYSKEYDILYITWLPNLKYDFSLETEDGIIFDISEKPQEQVKGIEIHNFSKRIKHEIHKKTA